MTSGSSIEMLSSPDWVYGMRERLDELHGLDTSIDDSTTEKRIALQLDLAKASIGLMDELPLWYRPSKSKKKSGFFISDGFEATIRTQTQTREYGLSYHPNHGYGVEHSELLGSGSFARVVRLDYETYQRRPLVPLFMGGLALKEQIGESTRVGIEYNSHSPIEPHPLDAELDHIYCVVDTDPSSRSRFDQDSVSGLLEGLHAIAVRTQIAPGESDLPEPKVLI